jgi:hypothetical protein
MCQNTTHKCNPARQLGTKLIESRTAPSLTPAPDPEADQWRVATGVRRAQGKANEVHKSKRRRTPAALDHRAGLYVSSRTVRQRVDWVATIRTAVPSAVPVEPQEVLGR